MGSNMAENHPVGFQWVMEARERGAEVIHVDPRFTRTSAMATQHVGIRAGADIAFLGGIVNYILAGERWFDEYVQALHERAGDHRRGVPGHRGPRRPLLRLRPRDEHVRQRDAGSTRAWRRRARRGAPPKGEQAGPRRGQARSSTHGEPPAEDPTLQHPRCVFQILKRHYARYTPELVAEACGCTASEFLDGRRGALRELRPRADVGVRATRSAGRSTPSACRSSAPPRSSSCCSGNIGRPGGGIIALRGHASIQGSTDIPTLYNTLPGYLRMPHVDDPRPLRRLARGVHRAGAAGGATWTRTCVSLLKAWWGAGRDRGERVRASTGCRASTTTTRTTGPSQQMLEGKVKGYIVAGENPAVGSANGRAQRSGSRKLDWLVVRDFVEIETAAFWYDSPEIESGEADARGDRHRGLLPAGGDAPREGRLVHEHAAAAAVALQGGRAARRLPLGAVVLLPPRPQAARAARRGRRTRRTRPLQRPDVGLPDAGEHDGARSPRRCSPRSRAATRTAGRSTRTSSCRPTARRPAGAGSTAARSPANVNQPARRKPHWEQNDDRSRMGLGVAGEPPHPLQPRLGRSRRARRGRSGRSSSGGTRATEKWTGDDIPDFDEEKPPDVPAAGRRRAARRRSAATTRSSCRPTAAAGSSSRRA